MTRQRPWIPKASVVTSLAVDAGISSTACAAKHTRFSCNAPNLAQLIREKKKAGKTLEGTLGTPLSKKSLGRTGSASTDNQKKEGEKGGKLRAGKEDLWASWARRGWWRRGRRRVAW